MKNRGYLIVALASVTVALVYTHRSQPAAHLIPQQKRGSAHHVAPFSASIDFAAPIEKLAARSPIREVPVDRAAQPTSWGMEKRDPAGFLPGKEWKNVGNETAANALETFLWAATNGEIEKLSELIRFVKPPALEKLFGSLSEDSRTRYGTNEKVAALMYAGTTGEAIELREIKTFNTSPTGVVLTAVFVGTEGKIFAQVFWVSQRPAGWQIMEHGHTVEAFVAGDRRPGVPIYKHEKIETLEPPRGRLPK